MELISPGKFVPSSATRSTPKFYDEWPLSTKKQRNRSSPGVRCRRPQRLTSVIARTAPALIRLNQRRCNLEKPHFITFKSRSSTSLLGGNQSRHYDDKSPETFFDQCFNMEMKIGEGSFGEVDDGQRYAVKRAIERFGSATDRQMKLNEVQKHELLPPHTNIISFVRAWEERGRLYIQTELCEYSLSDYTERDHNISEELLWNYLIDLLLAIKHLHDHDLLHLDVKPENIFITSDRVCKLGDFGLVFDLKTGDISSADEGDSKYLAPEMLDGRIGKAADIFSLGITLLELACDLDLPKNGVGWQQLRHGQMPEHMMSELSPDMCRIIRWMLDPDPDRRPTAEQLLKDPALVARKWRRSLYLRYHRLSHSVGSMLFAMWLMFTSCLLYALGIFGVFGEPSSIVNRSHRIKKSPAGGGRIATLTPTVTRRPPIINSTPAGGVTPYATRNNANSHHQRSLFAYSDDEDSSYGSRSRLDTFPDDSDDSGSVVGLVPLRCRLFQNDDDEEPSSTTSN